MNTSTPPSPSRAPRHLPWPVVRDELLARDPLGFQAPRPASTAPPAFARRAAEVQRRAAWLGHGVSLADALTRLDELEHAGPLGTLAAIARPRGRHALVAAHGPSTRAAVPALRARRDRYWLVAPLRSAIYLAREGIVADVVIAADRGTLPYQLTLAQWAEQPADIRRALGAATLLVEPFAPAALREAFAAVAVFDTGLGALPADLNLPFWGYSIVPAVSLAIALGAPSVGIIGVDLTAADGPRRTTWQGARVALDRLLGPQLDLLGLLARGPARLTDLGVTGIRKPGFRAARVDDFLDADPADTATGPVPVPGANAAAAAVRAGVEQRLLDVSGAVAHVRGRAHEARRLFARLGGTRDEAAVARLADLVREAIGWKAAPDIRHALGLLQPTFLPAVWAIGDGLPAARDQRTATVRTATLVFEDLLAVTADYDRWHDRHVDHRRSA